MSLLCRKRKYGIDSNVPDMPKLGGLTILMSEPRLYFMDVDGHRIQLTTEQLQNQTLWQRAVMEQATIMPPKTKDTNYQGMVSADAAGCDPAGCTRGADRPRPV
jgi:hypothetical protein